MIWKSIEIDPMCKMILSFVLVGLSINHFLMGSRSQHQTLSEVSQLFIIDFRINFKFYPVSVWAFVLVGFFLGGGRTGVD